MGEITTDVNQVFPEHPLHDPGGPPEHIHNEGMTPYSRNPEFEEIVKKFYTTERERQKKTREDYPLIMEIHDRLYKEINELMVKGVQFMVLHMDISKKPNTIHCGLMLCCNRPKSLTEKIINEGLRKDMEAKIVGMTRFKRVIWEM